MNSDLFFSLSVTIDMFPQKISVDSFSTDFFIRITSQRLLFSPSTDFTHTTLHDHSIRHSNAPPAPLIHRIRMTPIPAKWAATEFIASSDLHTVHQAIHSNAYQATGQ